MKHTWYGGHWNTIKQDPARLLMKELLTDPVPNSTASYTLKYKVQHFSLQLGKEKYIQVQPQSQGGRSTQPGVWGVGMKLCPSPGDVGTDNSTKQWFHCWHFSFAMLKLHYHLTLFHFLKLPPCLPFCPCWSPSLAPAWWLSSERFLVSCSSGTEGSPSMAQRLILKVF